MRIGALFCVAVCACGPARPTVTVIELPAARVANGGAHGVSPTQLRRFREIAQTPEARVHTAAEVTLGRTLWFDRRLSRDSDLSCNSCHALERFGVDGQKVSVGHGGKLGRRNAPSIFNAASDRVQFWDGRADTLEEQALGPLLNPDEMAMNERDLVARTAADPRLVEMFERAYREPPSLAGIAKALAAFERSLVARGRWDRYLAGEPHTLTREELAGLRLFLNVGCVGCHTGPEVGASMYQVAGVVEPWPNQSDLGRFEVTGDPQDRMLFRVPSLRNVATTAPYFHDGSVAALPDAVRLMARVQLGVALTDREVGLLVKFLEALSGELPPGVAMQEGM